MGQILFADHDDASRARCATMLTGLGYTVDAVATGTDAAARLGEKTYDIALLDVQLEDISGISVARRARDRLGLGIPMVAMTARSTYEIRLACLDAGMDDYLVKPVAPDSLLALLLRHLADPAEPR